MHDVKVGEAHGSPLAAGAISERDVMGTRMGTGEAVADEWEEVDIGKGLAQYNSVEIDRLKGMRR
jgi:glutamate 5-kinase